MCPVSSKVHDKTISQVQKVLFTVDERSQPILQGNLPESPPQESKFNVLRRR